MKKTVLSLVAICSFGLISGAQTVAIYEGLSSPTDISGTTLIYTSMDYSSDFLVENISGGSLDLKLRRVQIAAPPTGFTEQLCWGVNGQIGDCYPVSITNPSFLTPAISNISGAALADGAKGLMTVHVYSNETPGNFHYRYYVEDANGTKYDSVDVQFASTATIKEVKQQASFNVYPNPADDLVNLSLQGVSAENSVKLIDVLGNVVLEEKMGLTKKLDVSNFRNGVYMLTIYNNGVAVQTRRIVIRH